MNKEPDNILKIKTGEYTLSLEQLGNLMSEFYGIVLTGDDDTGILEFEFKDIENMPKAIDALQCFLIKKKEDF